MWSEPAATRARAPSEERPREARVSCRRPGEREAVDIGDEYAAVSKSSRTTIRRSSNLPGAPRQAWGIIRDIFTMGARPIALLNSLRFGPMGGPDARERDASSKAPSPASRVTTVSGSATMAVRLPSAADHMPAAHLVNVSCRIARVPTLVAGRLAASSPVCTSASTGQDGTTATMASCEFDDRPRNDPPIRSAFRS